MKFNFKKNKLNTVQIILFNFFTFISYLIFVFPIQHQYWVIMMSNDYIHNPSQKKKMNNFLKQFSLVFLFFLYFLVDQRNLFKKLLQFRDANKKLYFKSQNEKRKKQWKNFVRKNCRVFFLCMEKHYREKCIYII